MVKCCQGLKLVVKFHQVLLSKLKTLKKVYFKIAMLLPMDSSTTVNQDKL